MNTHLGFFLGLLAGACFVVAGLQSKPVWMFGFVMVCAVAALVGCREEFLKQLRKKPVDTKTHAEARL